jgi:pimeloyl-ACP methyl ester carboxylesterase
VKAVARTLGVARSSLEPKPAPARRRGRPPAPEDELLARITAVIAALPTYGYRRVHALLRRQAEEEGQPPPNHKRVWRVMKAHGLLLARHAGGAERRHDGRVGEVVVMVHSQAGQFGCRAAQNRPGKVKALVLLEPAGVGDPGTIAALRGLPVLVVYSDFIDQDAR